MRDFTSGEPVGVARPVQGSASHAQCTELSEWTALKEGLHGEGLLPFAAAPLGWKAAGSKVLDVEEGQSGAESRVLHPDHHFDLSMSIGTFATCEFRLLP